MVDAAVVPNVSLRAGAGQVAIPRVGFGVWQVPDDEVDAAFSTALADGYRHIDTARIYGNESGVGRVLARTDVPRSEIFVTTKVWNDDHLAVEAAFEASMQRLGLDVLDLYLIHWPAPAADAYAEAWSGLLRLRDSGRVRAVGVCNFHIEHLRRAHEATGEYPAINQIELHPYLQQRELREFCAENDIAIEAWSPLASGKQVLDDEVVTAIAAGHG